MHILAYCMALVTGSVSLSRYTDPTIVAYADDFPVIALLDHCTIPDDLARSLSEIDGTVNFDCISRPITDGDQLQMSSRCRRAVTSATFR
jgi:hypothetical protein